MSGSRETGFPATAFGLLLMLFAMGSNAQTNVTPAQYLASQPKPNFAPGHHLPHLTRWGWVLSSNATVELANNWGYALTLSGYATPTVASNVTKPGTFDYVMTQLASNNPAQYKLSVLMDRTFVTPPNGFWITNATGLFVDPYSNAWPQNAYTNGGWRCSTNTSTPYPYYHPMVSPEGADTYWTNATEYWMKSLRVIQSNTPIAIVLNGGEYGLGVAAFEKAAWQQDPRVQAQAVMTNTWTTSNASGASWPRYISDRKAHQLGFLTSAIQQLLPNRELSIFYKTDNEQNRGYNQWYLYWDDLYDAFGWRSDVMNTNTDLPSFEDYYSNPGSWTNNNGIPKYNLLTLQLNAVGFAIRLGYKMNYSWVNGGTGTNTTDFSDRTKFSDIPTYMGFLKCLYTSGMVGGVAGYFDYPAGGFDSSFPTNNPPHWLLQMMALAHVHALFSQLDNFLYSGDLLSGPQPHSMSADQPAYEFTNSVADATARVLARKLRSSDEWLVTAWAAAGPDRNVTVTIPALGTVQVLARASGAVYRATTTNLSIVDVNGILPTEGLDVLPQPPTNLRVVPPGSN